MPLQLLRSWGHKKKYQYFSVVKRALSGIMALFTNLRLPVLPYFLHLPLSSPLSSIFVLNSHLSPNLVPIFLENLANVKNNKAKHSDAIHTSPLDETCI